MINNTVSATFSLSTSNDYISGTDWIRLTQVEESDVLVKSELAELIDSIFGVTPCTVNADSAKAQNPSGYNEVWDAGGGESKSIWALPIVPPIDKEEFDTKVKTLVEIPDCDLFPNSDYKTIVRVVLSQLKPSSTEDDNSYTLRITNGKVLSTKRVVEEVTYSIKVADSSSAIVQYPISTLYYVEWLDDPVSKTLGIVSPDISVTYNRDTEIFDGSINWGEEVTGTLRLSYLTEYDLVTVQVFGDGAERKESEAIGFYRGLTDDTTLTPPEEEEEVSQDAFNATYCPAQDITDGSGGSTTVGKRQTPSCFYWKKAVTYCQCSGDSNYSDTLEKVYTSCPEGQKCPQGIVTCEIDLGIVEVDGGYVDCGESDEVYDPEYFEDTCCYPLPEKATLPLCKEMRSRNAGGQGLSEATMNEYKAKYSRVVFEGVAPEDGECGDYIFRQDIPQRDCCDAPSAFYFTKTHDELSWNVVYTFCAYGGVEPYTWSTNSNGLSISIPSTKCANVIPTECYCADALVYCTDACGQTISHEVVGIPSQCDERLPLELDVENSADVVGDTSSALIVFTGGVPPYDISVSGQGFYLDAGRTETEATTSGTAFYLYTEDACGGATYTITDRCGESVSSDIRSAEGVLRVIWYGFPPDEGGGGFPDDGAPFDHLIYSNSILGTGISRQFLSVQGLDEYSQYYTVSCGATHLNGEVKDYGPPYYGPAGIIPSVEDYNAHFGTSHTDIGASPAHAAYFHYWHADPTEKYPNKAVSTCIYQPNYFYHRRWSC